MGLQKAQYLIDMLGHGILGDAVFLGNLRIAQPLHLMLKEKGLAFLGHLVQQAFNLLGMFLVIFFVIIFLYNL